MSDLENRLRQEFSDHSEAIRLLTKYLSSDGDGLPRYTGSAFDRLAVDDPDRITPADLVAVSMLAIRLPARASLELLSDPFAGRAAALLREIGPDRNLWSASATSIADGSAADCLWRELKEIDDIGWVTANKLIARKRPRLLPVYDSVVRNALEPGRNSYWQELRSSLKDTGLRNQVKAVRKDAAGARHLSLLRVIDIVVWMRHRGDAQVEWFPEV